MSCLDTKAISAGCHGYNLSIRFPRYRLPSISWMQRNEEWFGLISIQSRILAIQTQRETNLSRAWTSLLSTVWAKSGRWLAALVFQLCEPDNALTNCVSVLPLSLDASEDFRDSFHSSISFFASHSAFWIHDKSLWIHLDACWLHTLVCTSLLTGKFRLALSTNKSCPKLFSGPSWLQRLFFKGKKLDQVWPRYVDKGPGFYRGEVFIELGANAHGNGLGFIVLQSAFSYGIYSTDLVSGSVIQGIEFIQRAWQILLNY